MKKLILASILATIALLGGCADSRVFDKVKYNTYGIFNADDVKNPNVHYEVSIESIIVAIIFSETIIVPVYIFGWDIMEPKCVKGPNWVKGQKCP